MRPAKILCATLALLAWTSTAFAAAQTASPPRVAPTKQTADSAPVAPRTFYGHRLEPREPVVLHGAGQSDAQSFAAYTRALDAHPPMLSMSYVDLRDDLPAYFSGLRANLTQYQNLIIPQIGLSLNRGSAAKHYEAEVARGVDDARLQQLCVGLRSLNRPVFLRIGYEFNGSWNGYQPASYVAAFRYITGKLRNCGLDNLATVWDWSPGAELDTERGMGRLFASPGDAAKSYMAFYPGDAWVDWWALNLFSVADINSAATQLFLADAARYRFPVMIAESTPKGLSVTSGQRAIDGWFVPFFNLIHRSPGIKAFCYIDWDWRAYPQWSAWGNARLEDDATVLAFYRAELANPLYANARSRKLTLHLLRASPAASPAPHASASAH